MRGVHFFKSVKSAVLDQPTVVSGVLNRGKSVAVAFGCWLYALQRHFNSTSMALPQHLKGIYTKFDDTSMAKKIIVVFLSVLVGRFSVS